MSNNIEKTYCVYIHISPSNKRYIGITSQKPHKRWGKNGRGYLDNSYFTNAIEKYGWDNFQHIIIARGLTEEEAKWIEEELIREWDSTNRSKGYNITKGGESGNGYKWTEEHKQQQSERMSGEGNPMFGNHHSEETRKKQSETRIGYVVSEETKQVLSEKFSGENNPMFGLYKGEHPHARAVICVTTNEIFSSLIEASEKYELNPQNIGKCCDRDSKIKYVGRSNGRYLIWRYYDEYQNFTDKELEELKEIRNELTKSVICLTTKKIFDNPTEGARYYGYKSGCSIGYCCKGYKIKNGKKIKVKSSGRLEDGTKLVWRYLNFFHNKKYRIA